MAVSVQELRAFGLQETNDEPLEEVNEQDDEEYDDEESEDEEDTFDEDQEPSDDDLDDDEDSEEEDEEPRKGKPLTKEQKLLRKFQSENDKLKADNARVQSQLQQFYSEFQELKNQNSQQEQDIDLDLDDDDFIDGKALKKYLSGQGKKPDSSKQNDSHKVNWVNQREDLNDINQYINSKNLSADPEITSIPTDTVGLYFAVKNKMLKEELSSVEAKYKKQIMKLRSGGLPPVGGRSSASRSSGKAALGDFEARLLNFGKKRGLSFSSESR